MKRYLFLLAFLLVACSTIKYADDRSFLVSAQAESPEFPVYLNGRACKDLDGYIGQCAKRIKSNEDLVIRMDPRPYSYTLKLACTKDLGASRSIPVPKNEALEFKITAEQIGRLVLFICRGEVVPDDRSEPVTGFWQFMADVVDASYNRREEAYFRKKGSRTFLVLGQHAKFSRVFDNGEWKDLKEKTVVEIEGDPAKVLAYSESYNMRFNAVGF